MCTHIHTYKIYKYRHFSCYFNVFTCTCRVSCIYFYMSCTALYTYIHVPVHTYIIHTRIHVPVYIHVHRYTCTSIHVFICNLIRVQLHTCTCSTSTYIHTYMRLMKLHIHVCAHATCMYVMYVYHVCHVCHVPYECGTHRYWYWLTLTCTVHGTCTCTCIMYVKLDVCHTYMFHGTYLLKRCNVTRFHNNVLVVFAFIRLCFLAPPSFLYPPPPPLIFEAINSIKSCSS